MLISPVQVPNQEISVAILQDGRGPSLSLKPSFLVKCEKVGTNIHAHSSAICCTEPEIAMTILQDRSDNTIT